MKRPPPILFEWLVTVRAPLRPARGRIMVEVSNVDHRHRSFAQVLTRLIKLYLNTTAGGCR